MLLQPIRVAFCPLPPPEGNQTPSFVSIGQERGILAWTYLNGDAIIRTEAAFWYVPKGAYKVNQ